MDNYKVVPKRKRSNPKKLSCKKPKLCVRVPQPRELQSTIILNQQLYNELDKLMPPRLAMHKWIQVKSTLTLRSIHRTVVRCRGPTMLLLMTSDDGALGALFGCDKSKSDPMQNCAPALFSLLNRGSEVPAFHLMRFADQPLRVDIHLRNSQQPDCLTMGNKSAYFSIIKEGDGYRGMSSPQHAMLSFRRHTNVKLIQVWRI